MILKKADLSYCKGDEVNAQIQPVIVLVMLSYKQKLQQF